MEGTRQLWAASGRLPEGLIYPELVHTGISETLVQNSDAFNAASQGAIQLVPTRRRGDFAQDSFWKNATGLINRRTVASGSPENPDVSSNPVPKDEFLNVKLNRRIGPMDQTLDSFRKLGMNPDMETISFLLGEQIAKSQQLDWLDSALVSLVAKINGTGALTSTTSPEVTLSTSRLVDGLRLFGDAASRIVVWVMHSKPYYDLVENQIALNIDGISNFNVQTATPVTLNRPVLVTDDARLEDSGIYTTLGLVQGACVLEESEESFIFNEIISGKDNLVLRTQGEYAYNLGLKGTAWDVANGGVNPDETALGTAGNWDTVMDDVKDLSGVSMQTL